MPKLQHDPEPHRQNHCQLCIHLAAKKRRKKDKDSRENAILTYPKKEDWPQCDGIDV